MIPGRRRVGQPILQKSRAVSPIFNLTRFPLQNSTGLDLRAFASGSPAWTLSRRRSSTLVPLCSEPVKSIPDLLLSCHVARRFRPLFAPIEPLETCCGSAMGQGTPARLRTDRRSGSSRHDDRVSMTALVLAVVARGRAACTRHLRRHSLPALNKTALDTQIHLMQLCMRVWWRYCQVHGIRKLPGLRGHSCRRSGETRPNLVNFDGRFRSIRRALREWTRRERSVARLPGARPIFGFGPSSGWSDMRNLDCCVMDL